MRRTLAAMAVILVLAGPAFAQSEEPSPPQEPSLSGNFLPAVLASSEAHRESLFALIRGRGGLPSWVRNMGTQPRYVALASERIAIAGQAMQLFKACQAGRCEASRIWVLYSADGKRALVRVVDERLGEKLFGQPSVEELKALRH